VANDCGLGAWQTRKLHLMASPQFHLAQRHCPLKILKVCTDNPRVASVNPAVHDFYVAFYRHWVWVALRLGKILKVCTDNPRVALVNPAVHDLCVAFDGHLVWVALRLGLSLALRLPETGTECRKWRPWWLCDTLRFDLSGRCGVRLPVVPFFLLCRRDWHDDREP